MVKIFCTCIKTLQQEKVLLFSFLCAILSMFFVPPNWGYLQYIDTKVIILLFSFMILVKGFEITGVFSVLSQNVIRYAQNLRSLSLALVLFNFFFAMWVTNDVALITLIPFTILLLTSTRKTGHMIPLLVLETVAANLGSMFTPFGNPQNLYLFSYYDLQVGSFLQMMFPVVAVSLALLIMFSLVVKKEPIALNFERKYTVTEKKEAFRYGFLFLLCILSLFGWVYPEVTLCIIVGGVSVLRPTLFRKVDYVLLLIFLCFFIFIGNVKSIPEVQAWMQSAMEGRVFLTSFLTSQVISNVPAAILLSAFTDEVRNILYGVNIGGLGTPIASLASLITLKFYSHTTLAKPMKYVGYFLGVQIVFLAVLVFLFI